MDNKNRTRINQSTFTRIVGACLAVILFIFECIICVQFANVEPLPATWKILLVAGSSLALDVLYLVELYAIKTFRARIVVYCFDFIFLLVICAVTGSTYLAALYCVILSQFYLNFELFRTKVVAFVSSCVLYLLTCIVGWYLGNINVVNASIVDITFACLVGLITLGLHFAVANFLIVFYRNNQKLTAALKEADESKKQLEEAYEQLSETAVFQERNRIARDIHDNAGHSMTTVIMQTEAAKLLIDSNPEEAKTKIISANIQAKNALEQMRESVHLLAGRNTEISLKEELEEIIAQTMDGTEVKIRYDVADVNINADRRRFICNSLKECLSNGIRHGGANAFYVELSEENSRVYLTVSDNGCGLPEDFKEGFGLKGIREKAANYGGSIVFESMPDDGCEIKINIKSDDGEGGLND